MIKRLAACGVALTSVFVPVVAHSSVDKDAQASNWAGYVSAPQYSADGAWVVMPVYSKTEVDEWVGMGGWNTPTILQAGIQYEGDAAWLWTEQYPQPPKHYYQVSMGDEVGVQVTDHKIVVHDYTSGYRRAFKFPTFNATGADVEAIVETHDKLSHPVTPDMFTNVPTSVRVVNPVNALYPSVTSAAQSNQISF